MVTAGEVLIGLGIFFGVLWLPLVAAFVTGKLDDPRERSNGSGDLL